MELCTAVLRREIEGEREFRLIHSGAARLSSLDAFGFGAERGV